MLYPSPPKQSNDIIRQAQAKVSRSLVNEVAGLSGLSKREIASLIGLSERALFKTVKGNFSILISEQLLLLRSLFEHGLRVFDHNRKALTRWLKTPSAELASPETGFLPTFPTTPPPPLAEMIASEPFDLMAFQQQQTSLDEPVSTTHKSPYPTPFSLLNTSTGIGLVDDVLTRIEAGVYR